MSMVGHLRLRNPGRRQKRIDPIAQGAQRQIQVQRFFLFI